MAQAAKIGSGLSLQGPQDWFEVAHICVCGFGLRQFLVRREDKKTTIIAIRSVGCGEMEAMTANMKKENGYYFAMNEDVDYREERSG